MAEPNTFITEARETVGRLWGLDRPLTKMELARALRLSDVHGGDYIGRLEKGTAKSSGPIDGLIEAFVDGYVPRHMKDVVKPGYPRGIVR